MIEKELIALLRLQRIPGIGPVGARKLVAHFGSGYGVFTASEQDLRAIRGIGATTVGNLLNDRFQRDAEQAWQRTREEGIRCLAYPDREYPPLLRECQDAPLVLFQKGDIAFPGRRLISIVGTRNMTGYGRRLCEELVESLVPYDPVIVSGMAYGIDICAQLAAMRHGLLTVSCLAHGLDLVYPQSHGKHLEAIASSGGALTEFWLGTPPEPMHFVRRNRIIAGMSEATIVVESASRGGSLVTADLAFGYDREVFAVPGRAGDFFSEGCNTLIRQQKAQLLQSGEELAIALNWELQTGAMPRAGKGVFETIPLEGKQRQVIEYLIGESTPQLDDIAVGCGLPAGEAASLLLQLEVTGLIDSLPGKRFRIREGANRPGSRY